MKQKKKDRRRIQMIKLQIDWPMAISKQWEFAVKSTDFVNEVLPSFKSWKIKILRSQKQISENYEQTKRKRILVFEWLNS